MELVEVWLRDGSVLINIHNIVMARVSSTMVELSLMNGSLVEITQENANPIDYVYLIERLRTIARQAKNA